ncbi:MAG: hypothetical protein PHR06_08520 [Candidatus Cloacimonetes bacterium]|nr:hypothetical protein [Candidatus Cloacimonadota bacterium]
MKKIGLLLLMLTVFISVCSAFSYISDEEPWEDPFAGYEAEENAKTKRVRELLGHLGNSRLIDLSKKNGITDYDVYLRMNSMMDGSIFYYVNNDIRIFKNDKIYKMP